MAYRSSYPPAVLARARRSPAWLTLAGALALAACAGDGEPAGGRTYVEAVFETRQSSFGPPFEERFHGFAIRGPGGRAAIRMQNIGKTVTCQGRSRVTKRPDGPGAKGLEGEAFIECSDGRYVTARYRYETNTRGRGSGRDYVGNRFKIEFMEVP